MESAPSVLPERRRNMLWLDESSHYSFWWCVSQARIEYKLVETELSLNGKYFSTQDVLDQYGKDGWELVAAYYDGSHRRGRLIFMRK
jgi:hypothetical protein